MSITLADMNSSNISTEDEPSKAQGSANLRTHVFVKEVNEVSTRCELSKSIVATWIMASTTKKNNLISKIEQFATFKKDWNGYGAVAIDLTTKNNGISIVEQLQMQTLTKITSMFPYPHGTIGIKWQKPDSEEIVSLEIGNKRYSCYSKRENHPILEFDGDIIGGKIDDQNIKNLETEIKHLNI